MKKTLWLLLLCIISTMTALSQTKADYDAAANRLKNYYNSLQTDSIYNMMSDKVKTILSQDKIDDQFKKLQAQLGTIKSCTFSKEDNNVFLYKTIFDNIILSLAIVLNKEDKLETARFIPYKSDASTKQEKSNIVLKTTTGDIYGTLVMPEVTKKVPVVLIIAGSGPTDRNGNNIMNLSSNVYKILADSLQKAGIASVRYDKRGVGESAGAAKDEANLRFDDMVNDAIGFIRMLKEDSRFSSVIVLGHSEGSLIGMIAAGKERIAAFISISGVAERADEIIEKQIKNSSPELAKTAKIILDSLDQGYLVNDINADLFALFRPSVQPYMISWLKYEPVKEIKKLKIPVLILQGTTDIQVNVDEAENLKKAYPGATLKIINGMNHILKEAPADRAKNIATYSDPSLPLCSGLMPEIIKFISSDNK